MRIGIIIERLKVQCPLLGEWVAPSVSLIALDPAEIKGNLPLAFCHCASEKATDNIEINSTWQEVYSDFVIQIAAMPPDSTDDYLESVRDEIKAALVGWQPDGAMLPIQFVGGEIVDANSSHLWWRDVYRTAVLLAENP